MRTPQNHVRTSRSPTDASTNRLANSSSAPSSDGQVALASFRMEANGCLVELDQQWSTTSRELSMYRSCSNSRKRSPFLTQLQGQNRTTFSKKERPNSGLIFCTALLPRYQNRDQKTVCIFCKVATPFPSSSLSRAVKMRPHVLKKKFEAGTLSCISWIDTYSSGARALRRIPQRFRRRLIHRKSNLSVSVEAVPKLAPSHSNL